MIEMPSCLWQSLCTLCVTPACLTPVLPICVQSPHNGFLNQGKQGVAVFVPPGTYVITQSITITQSNVVLRGASVSRLLCAGWGSSTAGGMCRCPCWGRNPALTG